jgi:hypothetical protein
MIFNFNSFKFFLAKTYEGKELFILAGFPTVRLRLSGSQQTGTYSETLFQAEYPFEEL